MKVEAKFLQEVQAATDSVFDTLAALSKMLKSDRETNVQRAGFDLDRVAADVLKWQRSFRLMATSDDQPPATNA